MQTDTPYLDRVVSVVPRATEHRPHDHITIQEALEQIATGRHRGRVEQVRKLVGKGDRQRAKRGLPAFTFAGRFSYVDRQGLEEHSGVVALDLDGLDDKAAIFAALVRHPNVLAVFASASGEHSQGLKVLAPVDPVPRNNDEHRQAYDAVAAALGVAPDPAAKDVSRLCYTSYDPDLYLSSAAVPVQVEYERGAGQEEKIRDRRADTITKLQEGRKYETLRHFGGLLRYGGASGSVIGTALQAVRLAHSDDPGEAGPVDRLAQWLGEQDPGEYGSIARFLGELHEVAAPPADEPPATPFGSEEEKSVVPLGVCLADVEAEPVRWGWPGWLAIGKVHVFDGDPGMGKSTLLSALAASVTSGLPWPDGSPVPPEARGGVVVLTAEDDPATTIRPRMEAAGADPELVSVVATVPSTSGHGRIPTFPVDVDLILDHCRYAGARLLVIDPVTAYLGDVNTHRDSDVRGALAPLAAAAEAAGIAVVLVRHLNKGGGGSALYRGGGSIAFSGLARVVWIAGKDPEDPDRRALAVSKNNLAAFPETLGYELVSAGPYQVGKVRWLGPLPLSADDLVRAPVGTPSTPALDEATEFLRGALSGGARPARDLYAAAEAAGIAEKTLKRAKARLGVKAERRGGVGSTGAWYWVPPDAKEPREPVPGPLSTVGGDGSTGIDPECRETPKGVMSTPPLAYGGPLAGLGPLSSGAAGVAFDRGQAVRTPQGAGYVTSAPEDGQVAVDVEGLPFLFPVHLVTLDDEASRS